MIPKIIHYCWFGGRELPALAVKCMNSWRKYLPDYQLRLWNEDSFDVRQHPYTKEARESGKYAFITDYVRLYVLYHYGGIYLDTDVEIVKSLDDLLHLPGFTGFESEKHIPTGIMACEKNNAWAKEQLDWYTGRHYIKPDGKPDLTSNVEIITSAMAGNGFQLNNRYQIYNDCMHFFPTEYFCPKSRSGMIHLTPNSYCIHHFAGSWLPWHLKVKKFFFNRITGPRITDFLVRTKKRLIGKNPHQVS